MPVGATRFIRARNLVTGDRVVKRNSDGGTYAAPVQIDVHAEDGVREYIEQGGWGEFHGFRDDDWVEVEVSPPGENQTEIPF